MPRYWGGNNRANMYGGGDEPVDPPTNPPDPMAGNPFGIGLPGSANTAFANMIQNPSSNPGLYYSNVYANSPSVTNPMPSDIAGVYQGLNAMRNAGGGQGGFDRTPENVASMVSPARLQAARNEIARALQLGPQSFSGGIGDYIRQAFGNEIFSHPDIQTAIRDSQNIMGTMQNSGISFLPSGSQGPSGSSARLPMATLNPTTGQFGWAPGFSPTDLAGGVGGNVLSSAFDPRNAQVQAALQAMGLDPNPNTQGQSQGNQQGAQQNRISQQLYGPGSGNMRPSGSTQGYDPYQPQDFPRGYGPGGTTGDGYPGGFPLNLTPGGGFPGQNMAPDWQTQQMIDAMGGGMGGQGFGGGGGMGGPNMGNRSPSDGLGMGLYRGPGTPIADYRDWASMPPGMIIGTDSQGQPVTAGYMANRGYTQEFRTTDPVHFTQEIAAPGGYNPYQQGFGGPQGPNMGGRNPQGGGGNPFAAMFGGGGQGMYTSDTRGTGQMNFNNSGMNPFYNAIYGGQGGFPGGGGFPGMGGQMPPQLAQLFAAFGMGGGQGFGGGGFPGGGFPGGGGGGFGGGQFGYGGQGGFPGGYGGQGFPFGGQFGGQGFGGGFPGGGGQGYAGPVGPNMGNRNGQGFGGQGGGQFSFGGGGGFGGGSPFGSGGGGGDDFTSLFNAIFGGGGGGGGYGGGGGGGNNNSYYPGSPNFFYQNDQAARNAQPPPNLNFQQPAPQLGRWGNYRSPLTANSSTGGLWR